MTRALDATIAKLDAVQARYLEHQFPDRMYHYTDAAGMTGIVTSKSLWLTPHWNLHIPTDVAYGEAVFLEPLAAAEASDSGNKAWLDFLQGIRRRLSDVFSRPAFLATFSEHRDEGALWDAYAEEGRGYMLAFDTRRLQRSFRESEYITLSRVYYDARELKQCFADFLAVAQEHFAQHEVKDDALGMIFDEVIDTLVPYTYCTRSYKYREETEFRVVWIPSRSDFSRHIGQRGSYVYPYLALPLTGREGESCITQVWLGPKLDMERTLRSLDYILPAHELTECEVRVSEAVAD